MTKRKTGTRGVPRAEREASILDAATMLFGVWGYALVSVDAVAKEAGVSKALVLSYFENKDNLYVRCVEGVAERLRGPVQAAVDNSPQGLAMALDTLVATFEAVKERPTDWAILVDPTLPADSVAEHKVRPLAAYFRDLGAAAVRELLHPDAHPEAADQAQAEADADALNHVWQAVIAAMMTWWFLNPEETPESLAGRFVRVAGVLFAAGQPE